VTPPLYDIVIPTVGRASLTTLLERLATMRLHELGRICCVDDRSDPAASLGPSPDGLPLDHVRSFGRGPAAARNLGIQRTTAPWVVFLDDDVVPTETWGAAP
jgi:glycosyltransferase involved in cell wall biosynthesis